jgi:alpha-D-xyloside xylohydrolase
MGGDPMWMRKTPALVFICGSLMVHCSQKQTAVRPTENGVELETRGMNVRIQFYSENTVRVVKWPAGGTFEKVSLCVIQNSPPRLDIKVADEGKTVALRSRSITLRASKTEGKIEYFTPEERIILKEKGKAVFRPVVYSGDSAFSMRQDFRLAPDEGVYGLGQHQDGIMNYRGKTVKLVQANTEAVIPFLVSTGGYGILWDNASKTVFEDNSSGASLWSDIGDNIDYYLIRGKDMDEVIAGYRDLTGPAPMYGKWAYGYWQSKEHYHTRDDLMRVAVEYRKRKIPIDNIVQDWDYWNGAPNWGGMFFDPTLFPRPKEMVDQLHRMNYHMMISIWPALGPKTAVYKEMLEKDYLYAPVGWAGFKYYDAFNPAANQLYWKYLKDGLVSKGIDAWWIDSTEPDVVNALTKESDEYEMKKVGRNHLGSWARYLNAYSLVMTDALYKNLRKETDRKRPYILTRSTFAGQQRAAATTWSGDIGANWDVYKKQITAGLNHCMAGIPYWTFDIGAFVIGAYGGVFNTGGKNPAYQELYTRMFQFGAFCPIFRSHGSETPREIWEMGEFADVLVRFDNLRYRLLPYIYSLAWKVTDEGYTIMRGLPMDFPADSKTHSVDDQFMFGPAILVCPVTAYMLHKPPEPSIPVDSKFFKTRQGKPGLTVRYYKDPEYKILGQEGTDENIDVFWYTGRPDFVTDSTYAIRWEGKLIPGETGPHQFHLKCFDAKRITLDGRVLPIAYTSTEQYTDPVPLEAGKSYDFVLETENRSTGAARMQLFWKTPSTFAREKTVEAREKTRSVYLPSGTQWIDFWTGDVRHGGQTVTMDAPIEKIPLLVRAGSIVPMGPFVQYATEKPANPIELRIYPGANGRFTLYEDENDNANYEKGVYATIDFTWDDSAKRLTLDARTGSFPGMQVKRTFNLVLVGKGHGTGVETTADPDRIVKYVGNRVVVRF